MGQSKEVSLFQSYKGDDFAFAMADFSTFIKKLKPEEDPLNFQSYSSSDVKISRRVLSHWRKLNLLDESDTTKLSFVECFWLALVNELRAFGMSLEKVKTVKDTILNPSKQPLLAFYIYQSYKRDSKDDYFLIVNSRGEADIGSNTEISLMENLGVIKDNYIKINFNLIRNKLTKVNSPTLKEDFKYKWLGEKEKKIIDAIRSEKYKRLSIRFTNGAVTHLDKESVVIKDVMQALKTVISEQSFGTITLTQQDGKLIHLKKIATEKL